MKTATYKAAPRSLGWRSAVLLGVLLFAGCGGGGGGGNSVTEPPINRAPVARDDNVSMPPASQTMAVMVLGNDNDPDGDALTLISVDAPVSGTATINTNGTGDPADDFIDYTAPATEGVDDSFSYTVGDGLGATDTATVWLAPYSPAAVARDDNVATPADTTLNVSVLGNDSGPDGGMLSIVSVTTPSHGTVSVNDNGTPGTGDDFLEYIPDTGYTGPDSFLYTISDGTVSDQAAINVMIGDTATRSVSGDYMLGPVADALIQVFPVDTMGVQIGADPIAQTMTNEDGNWMLPVPDTGAAWVVIAAGGTMLDPSDLASPNEIAFNPGDRFEILLAPDDSFAAMTVFASALLTKSRRETSEPNFLAVFANNRAAAASGFGFDVLATTPTNTLVPDLNAPVSQRQYALGNGGLSLALNALSDALGMSAPDFPVISALAEDLADCQLDGLNDGTGVIVNVNGLLTPMPTGFDLNTEIVRFRNNNFDLYGATPLLSIDSALCGQDGSIANLAPSALDDAVTLAEDGSISIDVLANDDPGDAPARVVSVTSPANGTVLLAGSAISYTPDPNFNGTDSFSYTISDAFGEQSSASVSVVVTAVNDVPVLVTPIGDQNALENAAYSLDISGRFADADGEALTFSATGLPASLSMSAAGVITGMPTNADFLAPPFTVTVSAEDGAGVVVTDSFSLNVINPNFAPTISDIADQAVAEDTSTGALAFSIGDLETAPDSLLLTVATSDDSLVPLSNMTLGGSGASRTLTVVPAAEQSGIVTITVSVSDGNNVAVDSFLLNIGAANDQPVITGQVPLSVAEEESLAITLADLTVDDPDNSYPADFTLTVQDGANYTRSGNSITPFFDFNGDLDVNVQVNDGDLDSPPFALTVTVTPINDAPVITGQNPVSVVEDDTVTIVLTDLVVSDVDDAYPSGFTLVVQDGADYVRTGNTIAPAADFSGTLSVPVVVNDGNADSNTYSLSVAVNPVNDAPEITGQNPVSTNEDSAISITLSDIVVDDPDNNYPADFSLAVQDGADYSRAGNTITPTLDFNGALTVPVVVNDGSSDSSVFNLAVTVTAVNDPPGITGQVALSTAEEMPLTLSLADFSASDVDNNYPADFTLSVLDGPNYARSGNMITPDIDFNGSLTIPVRINDGSADSPVFNATVSVTPVNDQPMITGQSGVSIPEFLPATIDINDLVVSDPDNSFPTDFTLSTLPGTNYAVTGVNEISPDPDFVGALTVNVLVNDGALNSPNFAMAVDVYDLPDRDFDGVGDSLEERVGGDPNAAAEIYVHIDPATPAGSPDGTTWALAYPSLQAAVDAGDIVESPTSGQLTYVLLANNLAVPGSDPDWTLNLAGSCDNMAFFGSLGDGISEQDRVNGDPATRLQGNGGRVVNIDGCTNIHFLHMTFANGSGVISGAGMRVSGSAANDIYLHRVLFENNIAERTGGGLSVLSGSPRVDIGRSEFRLNGIAGPSASIPMGGGAIYAGNGAILTLSRLNIVNNGVIGPASGRAGGGGIYLNGAVGSSIKRTTFAGNSTDRNGGAIHIDSSTANVELSFEDNIVSGNTAGTIAGGVYFRRTDSAVTVFNNLLIGNTANDGGAMAAFEIDDSDVRNNTFVYNHSRAGFGAAIAINDLAGTHTGPYVFNNIFRGNTDQASGPGVISALNFATLSCLENMRDIPNDSYCGGTNFFADPLFTNGFYLGAGSPAINASSVPASMLGLDSSPYTTRVSGASDIGDVDLGFHYRSPYAGYPDETEADDYRVVEPGGSVAVNSSLLPDLVIIEPEVDGVDIGEGHEVVLRERAGSVAGVTYEEVSPASPFGGMLLADLGDDTYQLKFRASMPGTMSFDVIVDGVTMDNPLEITIVP